MGLNIVGCLELSLRSEPLVETTNDSERKQLKSNTIFIDGQDSSYKYLIQIKEKNEIRTFSNFTFPTSIDEKQFFLINIEDIDKELPNLDFGLWYDSETNVIRVSRNHFGTVPINYSFIANEFFAFSTDLLSLLNVERVKPYIEIDKDRLIRYLTFKGDSLVDYNEQTFYTNIKSVLPGHILSVSQKTLSSNVYLKFKPLQWENTELTSDYYSSFRDLLIKSVSRSIWKKTLFGSHLSGGLDSSSLSAITKKLHPESELLTFYAATNTKLTNENHHALEVAKKIGSRHYEVVPQQNDLELLKLYTSLYAHPECMLSSPTVQGSLFAFAEKYACDVLMIGHDGDSIVGSGLEYIAELFYRKNWDELAPLLKKRLQNPYYSILSLDWDKLSDKRKLRHIYNDFFGIRLGEMFDKNSFIELFSSYLEISKFFDISFFYFFNKAFSATLNRIRKKTVVHTILRDELINRSSKFGQADQLSNALSKDLPDRFQESIKSVYAAQPLLFTEELFVLGNYYKIHNALPFYDKALFELCMAIPTEVKLGDGLGRNHFREAMKDILPEKVRTRPDKGVFGLHARETALRMYNQAKSILHDSSLVWEYVDPVKFTDALKLLNTKDLPHHVYSRSQFHIVRTISLAVWLNWLGEKTKGVSK